MISGIGPLVAQALGQQVWNAVLSNWGNQGAAADAYSNRYPNKTDDEPIPTVQAIALSPGSTVDEAVIVYNADPSGDAESSSGFLTVSKDRPWFGQIDGRFSVPLALKRLEILSGQQTKWGDTYLPQNSATPTPYGTAINVDGQPPRFIVPFLSLNFYLRGPLPQPGKRDPFQYTENLVSAGSIGVESLLRVYPIFGRRRVRLMIRATTANSVDIRVALGQIVNATVLNVIETQVSPATFGTKTTIPGNQVAYVNIDEPMASFLHLYVSPTTSTATLSISVRAID